MRDFFSPKNEIFEHDAPVVFESPQQEEPQEQPPPINEVAALKPRASQFGATELVQDELEFTPGVYDKLIPEVLGKDESDNEKTEEISTEQTKDFDTKSEKQEEPTQEIVSESSDVLFKPIVKPEPALKPSKSIEQGKQQKASQRTTLGAQAKIASPMEKKLTFNDLATGFLASWQNEGSDWFERKGNENIRPDFEEMKYLSYLQKIAWYMQNAWQRQERVQVHNPPADIVITGVRVTLDKLGNLVNASMLQSCGVTQLDDMVMRGIREGGPYPPLPDHFKKEIMSFEFGVKHLLSHNPFAYNFGR